MNIHDVVQRYFENPLFTKTKNVDEYSIYKCPIHLHLTNVYRFLVCIVPRDAFLIGHERALSQLKWTVFQTRELSKPEQMRKHSYQPKNTGIFKAPIHLKSREDSTIDYLCPQIKNVTISLLKKQGITYPDNGFLNSAFETYQTILTCT